jgi:hypothetical protein
MKVTGGCHCGHITYEAEVDPGTVRVCYRTDCQKLTGTVFRAAIPGLPGTFVLKGATPKIYIKTGESGRQRLHTFCPECGTPICATSPESSIHGLRLGTIDQRHELAPPARQQWCRSALSWSMDLTQVERVERQ